MGVSLCEVRGSIAVVLLILSVCHAQPWTQVADPGDGCECGDVDNCIYCTTTDSNNPCYNKCQWCIPQLHHPPKKLRPPLELISSSSAKIRPAMDRLSIRCSSQPQAATQSRCGTAPTPP